MVWRAETPPAKPKQRSGLTTTAQLVTGASLMRGSRSDLKEIRTLSLVGYLAPRREGTIM